MTELAKHSMPRSKKGPVRPPPVLEGALATVADAVAGWPGVSATVHWNQFQRGKVDGTDFYLGDEELGHLHLDGSIHLATSPDLGQALVAEGLARPFRYQAGWVEEQVRRIGSEAAVALFRRNYDHMRA